MKKLSLIIGCSAFILMSCSELKELSVIYPSERSFSIDFTPYTTKGFLITPEKYQGQYESIGIVEYKLMPGAVYKLVGQKRNPNYTGNSQVPMYIEDKLWIVDKIELRQTIDSIYTKCTKMGADALVNFKLEYPQDVYSGITNPTTISGYSISGYAIKRK